MLTPYERIAAIVADAGLDVTVNALQCFCFSSAHELKFERHEPQTGDWVYSVGLALSEAVLAVKKK